MTKQHRTSTPRVKIFAIGKEMEKVLTKDGEYWVYAEGHSDQTFADAYGVNIATIRRVRADLFGELERGNNFFYALQQRVVALEARIAELERERRVSTYINGTQPNAVQ